MNLAAKQTYADDSLSNRERQMVKMLFDCESFDISSLISSYRISFIACD